MTLGVVSGCAQPLPPESAPTEYPTRSDLLVVSPPKATPHRWYVPGSPPLWSLSSGQPDELAALLIPEQQSRAILDTSDRGLAHLKPAPRPFLQAALNALFGTPAEPTVGISPSRLEELKNTKANLAKSAKGEQKENLESEVNELKERTADLIQVDAIAQDIGLNADSLKKGGQLYRSYCQQCHGLTGDGNGPGGRFLVPLPRDYRQGIFKFITARPDSQGTRARRADLYRSIERGLDGSAMPSFAALPKAEIDALVSYVIHLSIRGEVEYLWLKVAADKNKADDVTPERAFFELLDNLKKVLPAWKRSNDSPVEVPADPYTTPADRLRAAARGHSVFLDASQGGCVACHANYGRSSLLVFDAWGGVTRSRDLTMGTFRVSRQPEDLYARLYCGIPGVNMPSHIEALKVRDSDKAEGRDRMWEVVHFIRAISDPQTRRELEKAYGVKID